MTVPDGCSEIAHGGGYVIYSSKADQDTIFIKGLDSEATYALSRAEWDLFSAVIAYADLKIRGVME